jgi:hypothetical protein
MNCVIVRRLFLIAVLLIGGLLAGVAYAETFKLANGETITGELLTDSIKDTGVQIKVGEGKYEKVPWANFSQEDLKKFAKVQKLEPLVTPFIEETPEEKIKKTEPNLKQPPRLERPAPQSLIGAFFSSGLGLLILLVLYAANIFAGYEVSIYRARPTAMVCGVSAVLPLIGPIIFLCLPTLMPPAPENWEPTPEAAAESPAASAVNPMQAEGVEHPAGLKLETSEPASGVKVGHFEGGEEKPAIPATVTFQRGQFTFNRRFLETKFAGFFSVVRRDADRDMVLVIKSTRGEYLGQRISRIAANDLHLQVQHGAVSEEVMIPFVEIQEIKLKHKDAK